MAFGAQAVIEQPYDLVVERTRQALHEQGLYLVNETDISAALHTHLDLVVPRQVVLDVWHLDLARAVVEVEPSIGLLLPCRVVVRTHDETHTIIEAAEPSIMAAMTGDPRMEPIAAGIRAQLAAALHHIVTDTKETPAPDS